MVCIISPVLIVLYILGCIPVGDEVAVTNLNGDLISVVISKCLDVVADKVLVHHRIDLDPDAILADYDDSLLFFHPNEIGQRGAIIDALLAEARISAPELQDSVELVEALPANADSVPVL